MSESESTPGPRRSHRERKQAKPFLSGSQQKRKFIEVDSGDDNERLSDVDEHDEPQDEEEEYSAPKLKPKAAPVAGRGRGRPKGSGSAVKRPPKAKSTVSKRPTATQRKGKKGQSAFDASGAERVGRDTQITNDNALFNAIMNPSAALQSTVEDFLESLSETPGPAQAELVNSILRCCGCNDTVNADEAVDYDGVVDALDNFTEALKQDNSPIYPLTSKLPMFKKFRKSLSEFIERLITSSADLGLLYTTDLMATLQTWIVAMSSSQLRSFRHTATVLALEVETALCDVAAAVEKEAEVVGRQREGERKRKASNKSKVSNGRDKELEGKEKEVKNRRTTLAEYLKEFVDGVFVHRYRDLDPAIRAECVRAIGLWFIKYPDHFLDGSYLRYVGWVLSDANTQVRLDAVKSLSGVYKKADYISSLQHFTDRFKPRLVEMATGDTELAVRVAVIQVLGAIDEHGLLEDEQRDALCLLVFDEEPKVRRAVSGFVRGVWEDMVEERLVAKKASEQEKQRAGVKALGTLLINLGKTLDKVDITSKEEDSEEVAESSTRPRRVKEVAALVGAEQRGRTALAVEALWDQVQPVSDWEALLDVLLLDHSASGDDEAEVPRGRRSKGKQAASEVSIDEAWRLEEAEEAVLLEVLGAALRKAKLDAQGGKKGEEETTSVDITRALIKGLPRLFAKHQTDEIRIAEVLLIPQLMHLDLYLEMRMIPAYASLWNDVIKQFSSHSSPTVLSHAVATIRHLMDATSLSNTNSTKILELEDELAQSLRDAVAGRDELEIASFSEDEVLLLGAICARLTALAGTRDMTSWMEEDEGGKQSSAWDIVSALVERGKLGYKEEEAMIDHGVSLLTLHIIWKARRLPKEAQPSAEELRFRESFREERESLLEKLVEYAVGSQSNTADGVRRASFQSLMNLHILFCPVQAEEQPGSASATSMLSLILDDEVQYRCAGFVQAEIERYADELAENNQAENNQAGNDNENSSSESSEDEDRVITKGKRGRPRKSKKSARAKTSATNTNSRSQLEREYVFIGVVSTFLRVIRVGAVHVHHSAVLLVHYGRLGPAFDLCSKVIVEVLREEGMYNGHGDAVVAVISQALRESFTLVLEGVVPSEAASVSLGKLLSSCLLIRGAQLSVVRRLDSEHVIKIHTELLTWIGKRLAAYESNKNKKGRKTAVLFFKVLQPLLAPVDNRDALKIKAHMDQMLAQAKVEISATSPIWESQRAYEKRLSTAMSKTKAPGKSRKSQQKSKEVLTTDDEQGDISDGNETAEEVPYQQQPAELEYTLGQSDGELTQEDAATPNEVESPLSPLDTVRSISERPVNPLSDDEDGGDVLVTPKASRKRPRSEDDEPEANQAPENRSSAIGSSRPAPSPVERPVSRASSTGEIRITRKRARH